MDRVQVRNLINNISKYRPDLKMDNYVIEEYIRVLGPYSNEDVRNRVEDLLSAGKEYYINPYLLVRGLDKETDKNAELTGKILCPDCGKCFSVNDIEEHTARHNSIKYLNWGYKKFLGREMKATNEQLMNMSEKEFDDNYYKSLEKFLTLATPNSTEYKGIKNVLDTRNGRPATFKYEEL
jgi:hypothetical protein